IYRIKADTDGLANLTNNPNPDFAPVASPDRTRISFVSRRDGFPRIFVMEANGANPRPVTPNTNDLAYDSRISWSPDGSKLAFVRYVNGVQQIWVVNIDGTNLTDLTNSATDTDAPAWSSDGSRIV